MKITTEIIDDKPYVGIVDSATGQVLVPHRYFWFKEINNYLDLSMKNVERVFLLYETMIDCANSLAIICHLHDGQAFLSGQKYQGIGGFYKGITIAKQNGLQFLMDFNEQRLSPQAKDIMKHHVVLQAEYAEAMACLNGGLENYGLLKVIDEYTGKMFFDGFQAWPLPVELDLWANKNFHEAMQGHRVDQLSDFDYANGLCLYKDEGKLGFMNRYSFPVCEGFDYVFSEKELRNNGIVATNPTVKYIERDQRVFKIQFAGDFVQELTQQPSLFLAIPWVKEYFQQHVKTELPISPEQAERYYFKIDDTLYDRRDYFNSKAEALISDILKFIPFVLTNQDLSAKISAYKALFGTIYSSSVVLEELAPFTKDSELVPYQRNGKWGFATPTVFPEIIVPCQYDTVSKPMDGVYCVKINEQWQEISIDEFKLK